MEEPVTSSVMKSAAPSPRQRASISGRFAVPVAFAWVCVSSWITISGKWPAVPMARRNAGLISLVSTPGPSELTSVPMRTARLLVVPPLVNRPMTK